MDRLGCFALFSFAFVALIAAANSQLVWKKAVLDLEMKTDTLRNRLDSLESNLWTRNRANNTLTAEGCPERFSRTYGDSCYFFSDQNKQTTWKAAYEDCQNINKNSYLVEIRSSDENLFLKDESDFQSGDRWIGLTDRTSEGRFQWYHTKDYLNTGDFEDWAPGEPNNYSDEDCVALKQSVAYQWNDYDCENTMPYICEIAKRH